MRLNRLNMFPLISNVMKFVTSNIIVEMKNSICILVGKPRDKKEVCD